jgi:hypothetical protein
MTEMRPNWKLHGILQDREEALNSHPTKALTVSLFHAPFDLVLEPKSTWETKEIERLSNGECARVNLPYWLTIPTRFEREDVI